jgi:hypothetical protein
MKLFEAKSSSAIAVLSMFVKNYFGGSSKAKAFIEGRKDRKCKTFIGTGIHRWDLCKTTYTFFCEYNDKGNNYRFHNNKIYNKNFYFDHQIH